MKILHRSAVTVIENQLKKSHSTKQVTVIAFCGLWSRKKVALLTLLTFLLIFQPLWISRKIWSCKFWSRYIVQVPVRRAVRRSNPAIPLGWHRQPIFPTQDDFSQQIAIHFPHERAHQIQAKLWLHVHERIQLVPLHPNPNRSFQASKHRIQPTQAQTSISKENYEYLWYANGKRSSYYSWDHR